MRQLKAADTSFTVTSGDDIHTVNAKFDTDWAGCKETRHSTSCRINVCCSTPITVYARTQSVIARSSSKSWYYGAYAARTEALFPTTLGHIFAFLGSRWSCISTDPLQLQSDHES